MLWVLKRDGSFEHPKHMLKLMGKKIFKPLHSKFCSSRMHTTKTGFLMMWPDWLFNPMYSDQQKLYGVMGGLVKIGLHKKNSQRHTAKMLSILKIV